MSFLVYSAEPRKKENTNWIECKGMELKQKGPKMMKDVLCSHTKNNVTTSQIILTQRVKFHFEGIQVKRIRSPGHVKDNHKNMSLTFIS